MSYATFLVQAAGALLTAAIFSSFHRHSQKSFLQQWTRSWLSLAVFLAGVAIAAQISGRTPAATILRFAVTAGSGAAAFLHVGWLLSGALDVYFGREFLPREQRRWVLTGVAILGIVTQLTFADDRTTAGHVQFLLHGGFRGAVAGVAFIITAWCVWRAGGGRHRTSGELRIGPSGQPRAAHRTLGQQLVAGSFAIYGIDQLAIGTHDPAGLSGSLRFLTAPTVGFVDFVLMFVMGTGVVIWLLEAEKHAASEYAERIQDLAYQDALTGLPNRQLFLDRLNVAIAHAKRARHKLAVFFVDLDRFKLINDSLGHSIGDELLKVAAQRIRRALRENDTIARLGGDEFTILTPIVNGTDDVVHVARKVHDAVRQPMEIHGRELFVTGSLGISVFPGDGESAELLLKNADTAMYRAKARGPGLFQLYTPEMNAHALEQLALEGALRRAVERDEFELHYQPIVRMADNAINAIEVVLRWRHPMLGMLKPDQFIRLAEATGLIVPIGEWTLRTACQQLAEWRAHGGPPSELRLAVNVSPRQLKQPGFDMDVMRVLREHRLPASALILEITESSAAQSDTESVRQLRVLRELGVWIAIDDFGTGYTSLAALRAFPVDALKIDTSFVRNLQDRNDAAIAAAAIALAKALGLVVVAEGVENPAQLEFLRSQGCEFWQGYLCCPPVEANEAGRVLGRSSGVVAPAVDIGGERPVPHRKRDG
jgi:diguanylate cyclase (GGDEF)-like protein